MNWEVFTPFISFGKHSNQNLKTQWMTLKVVKLTPTPGALLLTEV